MAEEEPDEFEVGETLTGEALRHFNESYEKNREAMERLAEL